MEGDTSITPKKGEESYNETAGEGVGGIIYVIFVHAHSRPCALPIWMEIFEQGRLEVPSLSKQVGGLASSCS